ncbi:MULTISPECIES: DUF2975 domain-containing protein [unclassified Planococcus (in: firmicutes)]|uniref:DUF2975 domain-containing protein n=2 Tax=Planococcus TaxID=1372 RepID=UPI000C7AFA77|nr:MULTISPECIES: DUF2975 domain-containing protein [unclassified Planococcus (in: firmicutes)]PKG45335.1 DUF2975 domain-containing protein [Planococcus sp. Urea-trap-24]PKG89069.1 DUF2975 domain-containing protein [Planococcus sp. Urea-3u-39]PKH39342.1 DUF2975 domain-containing protein [Planococcus sp. MB-3u-09]
MRAKHAATLFLKGVLLLMTFGVMALYVFGLPGMAERDAALHPETAYLQYPFLISAYIFFAPILVTFYQTFKLLGYIDRGEAFSDSALKALTIIKYCALAIILFIVLGELATILFIDDDITLGVIGTLASAVVAVFADLLRRLLKDAIAMKSSNNLIV